MKTKLVLLAFLALTFLLLSGCDLDLANRPTETPEPSPPPTPTETTTNTPTLTETPTSTETPLPLYWQCGPTIYPNSYGPVEEEAKVLPTGFIDGEFSTFTYLKAVTARACLTKLSDVPDPLFPEAAVRGKVIFFDLDGKAHEYNIMIGGTNNSGRERRLAIGYFPPEGGARLYTVSIKEALPILEKYYNNPDVTASRQIDINFATKDLGAPWVLGKYINQNRELIVKLIEALKTGRGFPENIPEDFFLYVSQVEFMRGFTP